MTAPKPHKKLAEVVEGLWIWGATNYSYETNGVGTPETIGALVNYLVEERGIPA